MDSPGRQAPAQGLSFDGRRATFVGDEASELGAVRLGRERTIAPGKGGEKWLINPVFPKGNVPISGPRLPPPIRISPSRLVPEESRPTYRKCGTKRIGYWTRVAPRRSSP